METDSEVVCEAKLGNLSVKVLKCYFIERERADIIVNAISTSLDLNGRMLSAALSTQAGPDLQRDLDRVPPSQRTVGNVVTTRGGRLRCDIFHIITPGLEEIAAEKVVEDGVYTCLVLGEEQRHRSIIIPSIGTGGLGFPPGVVAKCLLNAVFRYSRIGPRYLRDIRFALMDTNEFVRRVSSRSRRATNGHYEIINSEDFSQPPSPPPPTTPRNPSQTGPGFQGMKLVRRSPCSPSPQFFIPWRWTGTSREPPRHRTSEWLDQLIQYIVHERHRSPILIRGSKLVGKTSFLSLIEEKWLEGKLLSHKWVLFISGKDIMASSDLNNIILKQFESNGATRDQALKEMSDFGHQIIVLVDDCEYLPDSLLQQMSWPVLNKLRFVLAGRDPCIERLTTLLDFSDVVKLHGFRGHEVKRFIDMHKEAIAPSIYSSLSNSDNIQNYSQPGYILYACSFENSSQYLDTDGSKTKLTSAYLANSFSNMLEHGGNMGRELFKFVAFGESPSGKCQKMICRNGRFLKEIADYYMAMYLVENDGGGLSEIGDISLCYKIQSSLALACGMSKDAAEKVQLRILQLSNLSEEISAERERILQLQNDEDLPNLQLVSELQRQCAKEKQTSSRHHRENVRVPMELRHMGPVYTMAYEKACKDGAKHTFQTRIMLVGHYGAGKTSLKRSLLSQPFIPEHQITNSIETDPAHCQIFIDETNNWKLKKSGEESYNKEVAKVLHKLYDVLKRGQVRTIARPNNAAPTVNVPSQPDGTYTGVTPGTLPRHPRIPSGSRSRTHSSTSGDDLIDEPAIPLHSEDLEYLRQVINKEIPTPILEELAKLINLRTIQESGEPDFKFLFWDFAGQTVFYTTHQTFLTHRAMYLLVLDVTKPLNKRIETSRRGRHRTRVDENCPQTVAEYLDFWLNCIHTHAVANYTTNNNISTPPVIIVCTHKDVLLERNPASADSVISQFYQSISEYIETKAYAQHVYFRKFCVSNKDSDDPEVNELRKTIVEVAMEQENWKDPIPLRWVALRERLQSIKKESKVKTMEELRKEGHNVGIEDDQEFITSLRFYHELGDLVFFNEPGLTNFIILDPQWLIENFRRVITVPDFHEQYQFPNSRSHWRNLDEEGILHEVIINTVWERNVRDELVHLMKKFRLLLDIPAGFLSQWSRDDIDIEDGNCYLVPCLMPLFNSEKGNKSLPSIPQVLLVFRHHFMPVGLTNQLYSSLASVENWPLVRPIHFDCASFSLENNIRLSIQNIEGNLVISAWDVEKAKHGERQFLKPYLDTILRHVKMILNTVSPTACFVLKVFCQCFEVQETTLIQIGPQGESMDGRSNIFCEGHWQTFSTKSFYPWFDVQYTPERPAIPGSFPPEEVFPADCDLALLSDHIVCEWRRFAIELGLSMVQTQQARLNHPYDIKSCILSLLTLWRDTFPESLNRPERKIEKLQRALEKCSRNDLIQDVVSNFCNIDVQNVAVL